MARFDKWLLGHCNEVGLYYEWIRVLDGDDVLRCRFYFRILDPCSSSLPKNCGGSPVEGYVLGWCLVSDALFGSLMNFLEQCKERCKVLIVYPIKKFCSLVFVFDSLESLGCFTWVWPSNLSNYLSPFHWAKMGVFFRTKIVLKFLFHIFSYKLSGFKVLDAFPICASQGGHQASESFVICCPFSPAIWLFNTFHFKS